MGPPIDPMDAPAAMLGKGAPLPQGLAQSGKDPSMRKFSTLFVAAAMAVGTFGLTGCEEETADPIDTTTDTMESAGDAASDTMESAGETVDDTVDSATPTTAPATP